MNPVQKMSIEVIIPTYKPSDEFEKVLDILDKQSLPPETVQIVNTEEQFWNTAWDLRYPRLLLHHIKRSDFDHGGTRKEAAEKSGADILVFMTQDAVPADKNLIRELVRPILEDPSVGASYARQLPKSDCRDIERYYRYFSYPKVDDLRQESDKEKLGIRTYFCSDVCAAYRKSAYEAAGGFPPRAIFNEDMVCVARMLQKGYKVAYNPRAKVYPSHNYSCMEQLRRNFDLGVSHVVFSDVFGDLHAEGEGIAMVFANARHQLKRFRFLSVIYLFAQSFFKYAGYRLGRSYQKLPRWMIHACTMNPGYWKEEDLTE